MVPETASGDKRPPLREFVYLDEVSLRSLLASQTGALTEEITELLTRADEAEIASSISAGSPVLKAEISSRYQTSNSQGSQTSRKSIVQSLFKEFRELEGVQLLLQPLDVVDPPSSIEEMVEAGSVIAVSSDNLVRGALVEVEVELVADPIFRFSTIISEISDMSKEYPDMLAAGGASAVMAEAEPINRVLQRLLAGLIPLRARATNVVVVEHDGLEYLAPRASVAALGIEGTSLCIVGVTEHLSYWRDVRRVLFSGAKFTMLCRIARNGLHREWVPVKLSEVLAEIAPTFPGALDAIGKVGYERQVDLVELAQESALHQALENLIGLACSKAAVSLLPAMEAKVRSRAASCVGMSVSVSSQNEAFRSVMVMLQNDGLLDLTPHDWMVLRREARTKAGLSLFRGPVQLSDFAQGDTQAVSDEDEPSEILLDTEVIAIYW